MADYSFLALCLGAASTLSCGSSATAPAPVGQPKISVTKFTAFGDSITAGVTNPPCGIITALGLATPAQLADERRLLVESQETATSYPTVLRGQLASRYATQSLIVTNDGYAGECVTGPCTPPPDALTRLQNALDAEKPDVLLLQEGVNDLNHLYTPGVPIIRDALQTMVQTARARGVQVFLGTLLPQRQGACRGFSFPDVPPMNEAIRTMAAANGAILIDLYQAFGGVADPYIGQDGLHPNASGYQKMADTFFQAIQSKYEVR